MSNITKRNYVTFLKTFSSSASFALSYRQNSYKNFCKTSRKKFCSFSHSFYKIVKQTLYKLLFYTFKCLLLRLLRNKKRKQNQLCSNRMLSQRKFIFKFSFKFSQYINNIVEIYLKKEHD